MNLGGTEATVGFPDIGLQGFAPKLAKGEIASLSGAGDDPRYFQISVPVQPGNSGGALVDGRRVNLLLASPRRAPDCTRRPAPGVLSLYDFAPGGIHAGNASVSLPETGGNRCVPLNSAGNMRSFPVFSLIPSK